MKIVSTNECWLWAGMVNSNDYGCIQVKIDGKWRSRQAHRIVYEALIGEIPKGLVLDHLCRTPRCVNPDHLDPVTDKENILRGIGMGAINAKRTHCMYGHEFNLTNTYWRKSGGRRCRTCSMRAQAAWRHKHYGWRLTPRQVSP